MLRLIPALICFVCTSLCSAQSLLPHAHAHNDYEHARPLFDALDRGFCSVEADVWLVDGKLLVAHNANQVKPDRTLESLYLDPLRKLVKDNRGSVYATKSPFYLLIDVKSEAVSTYAAVSSAMGRYRDLFTPSESGSTKFRPITAVISGNRSKESMLADKARLAGLDGRPEDLTGPLSPGLFTWVSESWPTLFKWRGSDVMPDQELAKLKDLVKRTHDRGLQLRFWGTPDRQAFWKVLRDAGVDWIGTDNLDALKQFFEAKSESGQR